MRLRKQTGGSIVESGAALSLLLPIAMLMIFVIVEISYAYLIKSCLSQGARQAARDLAVAYGKNPAVANSRTMQDSSAFNNVRIANMINSSEQFDDPIFQTGSTPHTVHVMVRYTGGQYGLPTFPNPDPLNMAGKVKIVGEATYRLE